MEESQIVVYAQGGDPMLKCYDSRWGVVIDYQLTQNRILVPLLQGVFHLNFQQALLFFVYGSTPLGVYAAASLGLQLAQL